LSTGIIVGFSPEYLLLGFTAKLTAIHSYNERYKPKKHHQAFLRETGEMMGFVQGGLVADGFFQRKSRAVGS
jgi:hypothetical protein